MLKFFMRTFYRDKIYTDEPELFYEVYKWVSGLFTVLSLRRIIGAVLFYIIGLILLNFIKPIVWGLLFITVAMILLVLDIIEFKKRSKFKLVDMRTPEQVRTIAMQDYIRKFVSKSGRALGKKEWKEIKEEDPSLYEDLLCDECDHLCYFYSLEIALFINDSTLILGAVKDPFEEGEKFYAHAVILRNNYIYDSNLRQSVKYEDFVKLYKFKTYKHWNYDEYSKMDFRESERAEFRKWCEENNVLCYQEF